LIWIFALVITDDFRYAKETFAVCPLRFRSPVRTFIILVNDLSHSIDIM